ncbi:hypothetical protein BGW41_001204 [Actinomortierella wolfii]|nr:hypothetical protein BGW41_001204 [Actinomortierella wolfii]
MDVYALTKKQRPTHLTKADTHPNQDQTSAMPSSDKHSQQSSEHRNTHQLPPAPTLQDIERKHSQLPPQYRQALLEQQQRQHQQQLLQQQQQQPPVQQQQPYTPPSPSPSPSPAPPTSQPGQLASSYASQASHQRVASAPSMGSGKDADTRIAARKFAHGLAVGDNSASLNGVITVEGINSNAWKCGEIFCSVHCSKLVHLDQALDFNPSSGTPCRACVGCSDLYETWLRQGAATTTSTSYLASSYANGPRSTVQDQYSQQQQQPSQSLAKSSTLHGHHSGSNTSESTLGREDALRLPKSASDTIAIKQKPIQQDPNILPMPSVPHDWSWSTF